MRSPFLVRGWPRSPRQWPQPSLAIHAGLGYIETRVEPLRGTIEIQLQAMDRFMTQRSGLWAILVGGCIAGLLDILFAISWAGFNGVTPVRLLQTVASGLLGNSAYAGGMPLAVLGLALHFGMSLLWASIFLILVRRKPQCNLHPLVSGVLFGVGVFFVMRLIVLPLSAFPGPVTFRMLPTVLDLLSHSFLFGVPISLAARKAMP